MSTIDLYVHRQAWGKPDDISVEDWDKLLTFDDPMALRKAITFVMESHKGFLIANVDPRREVILYAGPLNRREQGRVRQVVDNLMASSPDIEVDSNIQRDSTVIRLIPRKVTVR